MLGIWWSSAPSETAPVPVWAAKKAQTILCATQRRQPEGEPSHDLVPGQSPPKVALPIAV